MQNARQASRAQLTTSFDTARSARLGLRSSETQLAILRRAADVAQKSLTDFILDSACLAAEQTLLDQRLFMVSSQDYQAFLDLLNRPARSNAGLKKALLSARAVGKNGHYAQRQTTQQVKRRCARLNL